MKIRYEGIRRESFSDRDTSLDGLDRRESNGRGDISQESTKGIQQGQSYRIESATLYDNDVPFGQSGIVIFQNTRDGHHAGNDTWLD
jgi:hypothetical protein